MYRSNRLLLAACMSIAVSASALAADLPQRTYTRAAPAPTVDRPSNVTGFYAGGFVGYGMGDSNSTTAALPFGIGPISQGYSNRGALGGLEAGYRYQFDNRFVFGISGMGAYSDVKANADTTKTAFGFPIRTTSTNKLDWISSVTGSLGYNFGRVLLSGKGGYAFAQIHEAGGATLIGFPVGGFDRKYTASGWTMGAELEWLMNANWSAYAAYDYYKFGGKDFVIPTIVGNLNTSGSGMDLHVAKLGVRYRTNWF